MVSFLVQTISGIREGNEVQVEDESDFNVYASDAAMSSSDRVHSLRKIPTRLRARTFALVRPVLNRVS